MVSKLFLGAALVVFLSFLGDSWGYKPVVIIHGIFDRKDSLFSLMDRIGQKHRGTDVIILDKLHRWHSMTPLWYQVKVFAKALSPIMQENPEGIHLIGFSQGGLVARALIQSMDDHNIDTFISLSSPQGGQYGDKFLKLLFPGYVKEKVWKVFYRSSGQFISVGNYWRDPHHLEAYYKNSKFLPVIDNQIKSNNTSQYKQNFMRLKRMVLIGGPDDGVIAPWESSHFGCYDESEQVVMMDQRDIYKNDLFGLRTLDEDGKLRKITVPGVHHLSWHKNHTVIDEHILPFLT